MLVPDRKNSEVGRQRRKTASGRLLHCCCICGTLDTWKSTWEYYGSYKDEEDGVALPKFCSKACRNTGGPDASLVTTEMKETARNAEWREPDTTYREATDKEKFRFAVDKQKRSSRP